MYSSMFKLQYECCRSLTAIYYSLQDSGYAVFSVSMVMGSSGREDGIYSSFLVPSLASKLRSRHVHHGDHRDPVVLGSAHYTFDIYQCRLFIGLLRADTGILLVS